MLRSVNLTKRYEDGRLALDAFNLKVDPGEIYCLLGANGAGKTTAINLFLNFIKPTSGHAYVNEIDVAEHPLESKKYVSYIPENLVFYGNYTARQNLDFFTKLGGIRDRGKSDYYAVLRQVGLPERAFEQPMNKFTRAMRQKVEIAIVMLRDTPAILLDEPTTGLDPKAATELMEILNQWREREKAILMATHDVFHTKEIADRVSIMREGRKVLERTREEIEDEDLEALYLSYLSYLRDS